jgi:hypothetical protein
MTSRRPPDRLYRVEWDEGFGWPDCERRERTSRNFSTLESAARQLRAISALPTHHRLVGTYFGRVEWEELPIETIETELARIEEQESACDDDPDR